MGWKGLAVGGCLGSLFGGALGGVFGALLGSKIETEMDKSKSRRRGGFEEIPGDKREMIFLASVGAMLAKLAKADGQVVPVEIRAVEHAFQRLGFSAAARTYAIGVFRRAKDDAHSIYEYAAEFAMAVRSVEVRELVYEILWDLACADGTVTPDEMEILRNIPRSLAIRVQWFNLFARERLRGPRGGGGGREESPRDELAEAYALLGLKAGAGMDEVKRAYREKAKKYHPDALRAQGLPEEMIRRGTEMMAKVNAAVDLIEKAPRG